MIKAIVVTGLLFFFYGSVIAQPANDIERLKKTLAGNIHDSLKCKTHYSLAKLYTDAQDSANAVNNYFKGIEIARAEKLHKLVAAGYNEVGN